MTWHVGAAGGWKEVVAGTSVGVGGVWKEITDAYVGAGGVWKKFYNAAVVFLQDTLVAGESTAPADATAFFSLDTDGGATSDTNQGSSTPEFTWLLDGSAGDYECLWNPTGDTGSLSGSALNTWLALSSQRAWTITDTSAVGSTLSATGPLSIGLAGTSTALVTETLTLTANQSP